MEFWASAFYGVKWALWESFEGGAMKGCDALTFGWRKEGFPEACSA